METIKKSIEYGYQECMGKDNFLYLSHLITNNELDEAIRLGEILSEKNPSNEMIYINLMEAYRKSKKEKYNSEVIKYTRLALINGHNTGYAATRLCISLNREKRYHAIINVCDAVLNIRYHFSTKTDKAEFYKRKQRAISCLNNAVDNENDIIINTDEFIRMCNLIDARMKEHHERLLEPVNKRTYIDEHERQKDLRHWQDIIKRDKEFIIYMESKSINETFKY